MRLYSRVLSMLDYGFNPRICKRCDYISLLRSFQFGVSIHASVKDATKKTYNRWITSEVSIHASVKDATVAVGTTVALIQVSIHASVKDATMLQVNTSQASLFQSTHL